MLNPEFLLDLLKEKEEIMSDIKYKLFRIGTKRLYEIDNMIEIVEYINNEKEKIQYDN